MFKLPRYTPTLVDELPRVLPADLEPGDLIAHRGYERTDEAGGRPFVRTEPSSMDGMVRIVTTCPYPPFEGTESGVAVGVKAPVAVLPPYWPLGEDRKPLTPADVRAAWAHVGARAVQ